MKLKLLSRQILKTISSASGIEIFKNRIYIIGDDSAWLHVLDMRLNPVEKIPLLKKQKKLTAERIQKKEKPDFEAMTFINYNNENILFIFGSGSKQKKRDKLIAVFPGNQNRVHHLSLEKIYKHLRENEISEGNKLNIEAAAANNDSLYLFHRGNISGKNIVFSFSLNAFADFVLNEKKKLPAYKTSSFYLPKIDGIAAGFSGAAVLNESEIIFSASVEDTENEIDDGSVLGSFIGILNPETGKLHCELLQQKKKPIPLKIESVCIEKSQAKIHSLWAVTDSDGGASELLKLVLNE